MVTAAAAELDDYQQVVVSTLSVVAPEVSGTGSKPDPKVFPEVGS
jgi:hypothetical protein